MRGRITSRLDRLERLARADLLARLRAMTDEQFDAYMRAHYPEMYKRLRNLSDEELLAIVERGRGT